MDFAASPMLTVTRTISILDATPNELGEALCIIMFDCERRELVQTFRLNPVGRKWGSAEVLSAMESISVSEHPDADHYAHLPSCRGASLMYDKLVIEAVWWRDEYDVLIFTVKQDGKKIAMLQSFDATQTNAWSTLRVEAGRF